MKDLTLERVIAFNIIEEIRKSNHIGEQCIAKDDNNKKMLNILNYYFSTQRNSGIDIYSEEFLKMMFPNYYSKIRFAEADFYDDLNKFQKFCVDRISYGGFNWLTGYSKEEKWEEFVINPILFLTSRTEVDLLVSIITEIKLTKYKGWSTKW